MKSIDIELIIDGLEGSFTFVEPSVSQVRPFLGLMEDDSQSFMIKVFEISLHCDGKHVKNALDRVGLGAMMKVLPKLTELLGFKGDDPND